MVGKKDSLKKTIERFIGELSKEISVEKVILFGSWVRKQNQPDSDIDLIVVSPAFSKGTHISNMQYLFRRAARVDSRLEPIPASPDEMELLDERTFLGQAVETGKIFFSKKRRRLISR